MIVLTAEINIKGENPSPFIIGESKLGDYNLIGENIDIEIKIDKRNIISLNCETCDRPEIEAPSFGLISSGGTAHFRDKNSRFLGFANAGILSGNEKIDVFINNTISKKEKRVGVFFANNWLYDNNNGTVEVHFTDGLEELQDIVVESSPYDFERIGNLNEEDLSWFYKVFYQITPQKFGFKQFDELDEKTKGRLKSIKVPYPYFENSSLWGAWEKLCQVALLHIYKINDLTVCEYNEGN